MLAKKRAAFPAGLFCPRMKADLAMKLHLDRGAGNALCFSGPYLCRTTHGMFLPYGGSHFLYKVKP